MKARLYYHPECNVIEIVQGDFIEFRWNGRTEESFFKFIQRQWKFIGVIE